jgi:hypothetical protein
MCGVIYPFNPYVPLKRKTLFVPNVSFNAGGNVAAFDLPQLLI